MLLARRFARRGAKYAVRGIRRSVRRVVRRRRTRGAKRKSGSNFGPPSKRARIDGLGDSVSRKHFKSHVVLARKNVTRNTRELYWADCCELERTVNSHELTQRLTDVINMMGIKVETFAYVPNTINSFGGNPIPITINYALVSSKVDSGTTSVPTTAFFRDHASIRHRDFSTDLTGIEMCHSSINTDNFHVLWRGKRKLSPYRTINDANPKQYTGFRKYFKIKRQLDYAGAAKTACRDKIFWVSWIDSEASATTQGSITGVVNEQTFITAFWRDVQV